MSEAPVGSGRGFCLSICGYGGLMLGVRTSQVFTSRWKALLWAGGVMLTAYCSIPAADEDSAAATARSGKQGQPSEHELQAQQIIKNLDALKGR